MNKIMFKQVELCITDNNDNSLHEGDIVEMKYSALGTLFKIKGVIRYNKKEAQFIVKKRDSFLAPNVPLSVRDRSLKKLGNVYANPELLD